jgi:hypothetical protein
MATDSTNQPSQATMAGESSFSDYTSQHIYIDVLGISIEKSCQGCKIQIIENRFMRQIFFTCEIKQKLVR